MKTILVDYTEHQELLPLTFTRSAADLRIGILTIKEKWEKRFGNSVEISAPDFLKSKYGKSVSGELLINSTLCPDPELLEAIDKLNAGESLQMGEVILAQKFSEANSSKFATGLKIKEFDGQNLSYINKPWKIFSNNAAELQRDFELLTSGRSSAKLSTTNTIIGDKIFIEEGVEAECAIFNTSSGPIYLGKGSEVMEGSVIRGGLALCEHSTLKLSSKIYGATTIGPHSKVGGEVNNSVITGYSNKGHDGFLGNAVLGEWCNLGADTNNSNLKNNYEEVKLWSYRKKGFEKTGLQFCGLIMGDHSKCGINTMFNTGTVVGVSANIFGAGFPRNFIPSFSWGGAGGLTTYKFEKAIQTARLVMERRSVELTAEDEEVLRHIFDNTSEFRRN